MTASQMIWIDYLDALDRALRMQPRTKLFKFALQNCDRMLDAYFDAVEREGVASKPYIFS